MTTGYDVSTLPDGRTRVLVHVEPFNTIGQRRQRRQGLLGQRRSSSAPPPSPTASSTPNGTVIVDGGSVPFNVQDGAEPNSPVEAIAKYGTYADNGRVPILPVNPNGCSASSNSCTGKDPTYIDELIPGFISFPGDIDWYELPGVRAGSRISVDLTNLPLDADLVLYGPSGTGTPPTLFPASAGAASRPAGRGPGARRRPGRDLDRRPGPERAASRQRIPVPGSTRVQAPMTPLSISQHSGTDPESVGVDRPRDRRRGRAWSAGTTSSPCPATTAPRRNAAVSPARPRRRPRRTRRAARRGPSRTRCPALPAIPTDPGRRQHRLPDQPEPARRDLRPDGRRRRRQQPRRPRHLPPGAPRARDRPGGRPGRRLPGRPTGL